MLRNIIRLIRRHIRSLITIGINLNRGQLLKGNSRSNRLRRIINLNLDNLRTLSTFRSNKVSLTSTVNSLRIRRINQLRIQMIILTSNKTLIGHRILNGRTIDNTSRTLSKLSLRTNLWLQLLFRRTSRWSRFAWLGTWLSGLLFWSFLRSRFFLRSCLRGGRLLRNLGLLFLWLLFFKGRQTWLINRRNRLIPILTIFLRFYHRNESAIRAWRDINLFSFLEFNRIVITCNLVSGKLSEVLMISRKARIVNYSVILAAIFRVSTRNSSGR